PSELLPRVHRVVSLLKRWLLGTHQGAVSFEHLDYYLDEFTFRFNRRNSRHRGKLFFRLVQQAVAAEPTTYRSIMGTAQARTPETTTCWGYLSEVDTPNAVKMIRSECLHYDLKEAASLIETRGAKFFHIPPAYKLVW